MAPQQEVPNEAIAIVGMACRFPGGAHSPEQFYQNLTAGESAWCEFPSDRLNIDGFYHPSAVRHESFHFKGAHFIKQNIAAFDSEFFSMSATESNSTDVQQRILLEVAYEAVENAGIPKEVLAGSNASVYVGSFVKDYEQVSMRDTQNLAADCATGNGIAIMSNRISYFFDIHGPSMTIDTGCSASLICMHQAVQSLLRGESSLAMAGGAGMILTPSTIMPMVSLGFLSPDGRCYAFDSRANGYGRGEGVGIVVMKRLSDAIRDNDTIRGVIRGTATNQDGRTSGITLPSAEAQVVNIRKAYRDAGLDFSKTMFVECHGTGTQAGDPRELKAISDAFCNERDVDNPIMVGSAKTNIGHLEGSAGVAGVIKAVMTIENGKIPKHLNFESWNPSIDHKGLKVNVALENTEWPVDGLRRISVNSFGFGGSNAHAIIDDAAHYLSEELQVVANHNTKLFPQDVIFVECDVLADKQQPPQLFVVSAYDQGGVTRIIDAHQPYLLNHASEPTLMRDYAYTLLSRRSTLQYKSYVVARSQQELTAELERVKKTTPLRSSSAKGLNVAFVFCGQGAQFAGMGKELLVFEPFRSSLEACGAYLQTLDTKFDLIGTLQQTGAEATKAVNKPSFAQPATTAVQIALVDLLKASGVKATAVVGHSSGEIAAAYAAGLISKEDALSIAYYRGKVASKVTLKGSMLAAALSAEAAQKFVNKVKKGSVCVACINSPESVTLSGDSDQILLVQKMLEQDEITNKMLVVETAYHSHHMQTVSEEYEKLLATTISKPTDTESPVMFSSVLGQRVSAGQVGPDYWVRNMVSPVRFETAMSTMIKETKALRPDVFLEVSPHSVFRQALTEIVTASGDSKKAKVQYFPMMARKQDASVTALTALGDLWSRGLSLQLDWLHKGPTGRKPKCLVDLPTYPWNHSQTYWHESHLSKAHRFRKFGAHDFLGAMSPDSVSPQEPRWRGFIDIAEQPWIEHHKIQTMIMYPAAGMVVMAIEAAKQVVDNSVDSPSDILDFEVSNFKIEEPMVIPEGQTRLEYNFNATRVKEVTVNRLTTWRYTFAIYSILDSSAAPPYQHTTNARGTFAVRFKPKGLADDLTSIAANHIQVSDLISDQFHVASSETFSSGGMVPREFYERLNIIGLTYGRLFRNLTAMTDAKTVYGSQSTKYCYSKVTIPNTKACMPEEFETPSTIHPATLDAMFQSLFVLGDKPMVPHFIQSIRISAAAPQGAGTQFVGYSEARKRGTREAVSDIAMWHGENQVPVVDIRGLTVVSMSLPGKAIPDFLPHHRHLCSQIVWKEFISSATDGSVKGTLMPDFEGLLDMMGHKTPTMRILQIGGEADTVALTLRVLGSDATARLGKYTICDETDNIFDTAQTDAKKDHRSLLEYAKLDGPRGLYGAVGEHQFDLVIADRRKDIELNVLLQNVKPTGLLAWTHQQQALSEYVGAQVGGSDTDSQKSITDPTPWLPKEWIYRSQSDPSKLSTETVVILVPDNDKWSSASKGAQLEAAIAKALFLDAHGLTAEVMTLSTYLETGTEALVISILEADNTANLVYDIGSAEYAQVHALLEKANKGLLWVTSGAQMDTAEPKQSLFLGWSRTVRSEEPDKAIVCLDLDVNGTDVQGTARVICNVFFRSFASTDPAAVKDTEFAEKGGRVYVPRLEPLKEVNDVIENGYDHVQIVEEKAGGRALKLVRGPNGVGSLHFREDAETDREPLPHEVVIEVDRCYLLPDDLDKLSGASTEAGFGSDVCGRVSKVGSDVTGFSVDHEVTALVRGSLCTRVIVDQRLVHHIHKLNDNSKATCPPTCLVTASYCLRDVRKGDTVLIHGAAGVQGQAATIAALIKCAEVFIVVPPGRWEGNLRVANHKVAGAFMDNSTLKEKVMSATAGKGMDFIFNSTPDHRSDDFEMVRQYGQVIHLVHGQSNQGAPKLPIGKSLDLKLFDFASFQKACPDRVLEYFDKNRSLLDLELDVGTDRTFGEIGAAFEQFGVTTYDGAFTLRQEHDEMLPVGHTPSIVHQPANLDGNATYLVTGGLGGVGLDVLKWLADHGANHLTILSRSGPAKHGQAVGHLTALQERGVEVVVKTVDICDEQACLKAVQEIEMERPVKGVVQAAAVIKDGIYQNLTHADWAAATRVKTVGSFNLHQSTIAHCPHVSFFVFLSSAAGIIGNLGQANYAAGNAFQDALARHRQSLGMHSVSIDMGPILGAGMVAEDEALWDILRAGGFIGVRLEDFHTVLDLAVTDASCPPQVVMGVGTGGLVKQTKATNPFWTRTALFSVLNRVDIPPGTDMDASDGNDGSRGAAALKPALQATGSRAEAVDLLLPYFVRALGEVMGKNAAEIDPDSILDDHGPDSLRMKEILDWISSATGVKVAGVNAMPLRGICVLIVENGGFGGGE